MEDTSQKTHTGVGLQEEVRKSDEGFEGVDKSSRAKVQLHSASWNSNFIAHPLVIDLKHLTL